MTTPRQQLVDAITPLLPTTWKLIPYQRNVDTVNVPTVMIKQATIAPLPQAPLGALTVDYVATLISPHTDVEKAEAQLDDDAITLLDILLPLVKTSFQKAEKAMLTPNGPLCYDFTFSIGATRTD